MGAGLASSLAGNRILNGCLLAPSHRHTRIHHPPVCVFSPCPHPDSSHTLYYSELHQSNSSVCVCVCVCVCVPPEAMHRIVSMTSVASSFGPHLSSHSSRLRDPDRQEEEKGTPPRQDVSLYIQVSSSSSKSSW